MFSAGFGKRGILTKEAITRMNGISAGFQCLAQDKLCIQVTGLRRSFSDKQRFIRMFNMQAVTVCLGIDGY
ncbi:hypothetical protein D3C73_1381120 [compost metagenome]